MPQQAKAQAYGFGARAGRAGQRFKGGGYWGMRRFAQRGADGFGADLRRIYLGRIILGRAVLT